MQGDSKQLPSILGLTFDLTAQEKMALSRSVIIRFTVSA